MVRSREVGGKDRMKAVLTRELIDQIVFGMENQEEEFALDLETMSVLSLGELPDEDQDEERYIPLPDWQSVDGFSLMERFVQKLHNPLARTELQRILLSGKGVFRQFKDCLRQYPGVAKLWYRYKENHMRNLVTEWYVNVMETAGISYEEPEFEDTEELVLDDFDLRLGTESFLITELEGIDLAAHEAACLNEVFPPGEEFRRWLWEAQAGSGSKEDVLALLLTPGRELSGFCRLRRVDFPSGESWGMVRLVYVLPEFRGLGAASTMIKKLVEGREALGIERIYWDLPASASFLEHGLEQLGFSMGSVTHLL